jgi:hypothetical protein
VVILSEVLWKDTYSQHANLVNSVINCLASTGTVILSVVHRPSGGEHTKERDVEFISLLHSHGLATISCYESFGIEVDSEERVAVYLFVLKYP